MPLVSILINNFNYGRYLDAAIRSALDQTHPDTEVIVVDDGSTDCSRAVIEGFGSRITALFQNNQGQVGAVNTGYGAARGAIVLILDADDTLNPEAAATIVEHWRPGLSKIQFRLAIIDADGALTGGAFPNYPAGLTPERLRAETLRTGLHLCPPTSGNAYGRSFLDRIMPLRTTARHADGPINSVAPLYGDVLTLDQTLGGYRMHGDNAWSQAGITPERFRRGIAHDLERVAFLRDHAARLGLVLAPNPLRHAVDHLQYRLASRKLHPGRHPVADDTVPGLAGRGVLAALRADRRVGARLALAAWFLVLAVAPPAAARRLIALRFVPGRRPAMVSRLLRRLGALGRNRDPGASPAP